MQFSIEPLTQVTPPPGPHQNLDELIQFLTDLPMDKQMIVKNVSRAKLKSALAKIARSRKLAPRIKRLPDESLVIWFTAPNPNRQPTFDEALQDLMADADVVTTTCTIGENKNFGRVSCVAVANLQKSLEMLRAVQAIRTLRNP